MQRIFRGALHGRYPQIVTRPRRPVDRELRRIALPGAMFANHWLTFKGALLVVYVVLGTLALKRAATPRARIPCFIAALAVYTTMPGIARAHHPLGWPWSWNT